ncbi:MAG: ribonuclease PH [Phycisphaerae bacterium]|nr:ribonuclease PH [Phycisphaerae bacterium]
MSRAADQLRPLRIERHFPTQAPGSVLISMGETRVLCTAGFGTDVPKWLLDAETGEAKRGWVTAEYSMLPGATPQRKRRGPDGRGTEIQRLIGRALRAAVDLDSMPGLMVQCDCDVLCADGGTRTAAITGAYVALADALAAAREKGRLGKDPVISPVAAISVGIVDGQAYLDLDYELDVRADVDMNVVMNGAGKYIEVQGTGEQGVFDRTQLDGLLDLAAAGIKELIVAQQQALGTD